jgi:uncharacterized repeat protein (TIGR01451 family)
LRPNDCGAYLLIAILLAARATPQVTRGGGSTDRPIELRALVEQVVEVAADDGRHARVLAAADFGSGDEVVFTIAFSNFDGRTLGDVRISVEIPGGMQYIEDTAFAPGSEVLYSVDGGRSFWTAKELARVAGGRRRAPTAADYTHIRWRLLGPLAADAKGYARFRARVL